MALGVHAFKRIDQSLVPHPELKGTPHQYIQPELVRLNVSRNNTKIHFLPATRLAPWHALRSYSFDPLKGQASNPFCRCANLGNP